MKGLGVRKERNKHHIRNNDQKEKTRSSLLALVVRTHERAQSYNSLRYTDERTATPIFMSCYGTKGGRRAPGQPCKQWKRGARVTLGTRGRGEWQKGVCMGTRKREVRRGKKHNSGRPRAALMAHRATGICVYVQTCIEL